MQNLKKQVWGHELCSQIKANQKEGKGAPKGCKKHVEERGNSCLHNRSLLTSIHVGCWISISWSLGYGTLP